MRSMALLLAAVVLAPAAAAAEWRDPTPHTVQLVTVDDGVQLEVLDWGGTGQPVVLLTGSGHTAHVYDDFAPRLLDCCHVLGITRRGYGASSRPQAGYDDQRLADDVFAVLDHLQLQRPILVGHSMAGGEMTTLGRQHSDRLGGLVYLDALCDLEDDPPADKEWSALQQQLPAGLQPTPECAPIDRSSFAAYRRTLGCRMGFALPESELRQGFEDVDGAVGPFRTPDWVSRAIGQGQVFRRDYSGIRVPVMVLMNDAETTEALLAASHYQPASAAERDVIDRFMARSRVVFGRWTAKLFRHVPDATIVRYPLAGHYVFLTRDADILREIHGFVERAKTQPPAPAQPITAWRDPSPHQVKMVTVDSTVRLEVLDWGGAGRPLLFVGCYLSAHVYDDIAPKLTDRFHVYAVTRRGVGASDRPASGYDPRRRAEDILEVITATGMQRPILVGNSCGGDILHALGGSHPDRLGGLVYLDAAEDPTLTMADYNLPSVDRSRLPAYVGTPMPIVFPEAEQRLTAAQPIDPAIRRAIVDDNKVRPDYARIRVPVLAIYRSMSKEQTLRDYPPKTDDERAMLDLVYAARRTILERWQRDLLTGVPGARIVELPGANLYMFLSNEADVIREVRAFAATLP